jgi:hypothetical protein
MGRGQAAKTMILAGGGTACFVFMRGMLADADDRECRCDLRTGIPTDIC